ncbi:unnamed protein product, partial [Prunus brigantina]
MMQAPRIPQDQLARGPAPSVLEQWQLIPAEPGAPNSFDLGFVISEYPGLRSTIRRILNDPINTWYHIREFQLDPTVRTNQTRKSHNRQNPFETQTGQGSYPRFKTSIGGTFVLGPTPKNGRKWPEFQFQNRPKPRVSNSLPYAHNQSNPTQPSGKASKIVQKAYLNCRIWCPEEREQRRRRFGLNGGNHGGRMDGDGGEAPG